MNKIIDIKDWFSDFESEKTFLITGPCSAESENQVFDTAKAIRTFRRSFIFRAGIWKPRTRPNSFEGVGDKGLEWLKKLKNEYNIKSAVEVANPLHVEKCLKNNIDLLWIGARTVSNPFSVQEIADSLKGVNIPVLVKNPVNPDLELWIGAIERLYNNGINKIGAIHRGFYPFEKTIYRNIPKWELAIDLKIKLPNISIVCDPSHIAGNPDLIFDISQKSLDLNYDGLMIESHIEPKIALSDKFQQITPLELKLILDKLVYRSSKIIDGKFADLLNDYRNQIDSIDFQLIELMIKRMNIVDNIGEYKAKNNISIFQIRRWEDIIKTRSEFGMKNGLSHEFISKLLELVHKESISRQNQIMNNHSQS